MYTLSMPICAKCSDRFPNIIVIDGKMRMLCSRKYCLKCSPFGLHNTKKIHVPGVMETNLICTSCGRKYVYVKMNGSTRLICNSCVQTRRKRKMKKRGVALLGGICKKCGYSKCIDALSFHHLDQNEKKFTISRSYNISWDRLVVEIKKCDLLCSNCHIEIHSKQVPIRRYQAARSTNGS